MTHNASKPVEKLFRHRLGERPIRPDLVVVAVHGRYGVAVVVDGWYLERRDAERVAHGYWRELLGDVVTAHGGEHP